MVGGRSGSLIIVHGSSVLVMLRVSCVRAQQMMKKMTIIFQGSVQSLKLFAFYTKALLCILLYEGRMSNDFDVEKLMIWGSI